MKVNFIRGKINLHRLPPMIAVVCPTDSSFSGTGAMEKAVREAAGAELAARLKGTHLKTSECLVTEGYNLKHNYLIHTAVPHVSYAAKDPDCLRKAYRAILQEANPLQHGDVVAIITHIAIPLLGTGAAGWDYATSMEALWQEILAFHRRYENRLQVLDIFYPDEAYEAVKPYLYRTSQAFFSNQRAWGTWGEGRLWLDLMDHFDNPKFNRITPKDFIEEIQRYFHNKTGQWLSGDLRVTIREYALGHSHGEISGGFACLTIPVLVSNLVKLRFYPVNCDSFLIPVTLPVSGETEYNLTLPYELLPVLTHLRSDGFRMNETVRHSLDFENLYFITIHHHKYFPDLIDHYSLDVEASRDRHYSFSEEAGQRLVRMLHEHPRALIRGLKDYLNSRGGPALEKLVGSVAYETFSF